MMRDLGFGFFVYAEGSLGGGAGGVWLGLIRLVRFGWMTCIAWVSGFLFRLWTFDTPWTYVCMRRAF